METKIVYKFSPTTGEYIGTQKAYESPLETGHFHIPAYCSEIEPILTTEENEAIIWNGASWILIEDFRGTKGYINNEPFEVKELGPLPNDFSYELSPKVLTIDAERALKLEEISKAYLDFDLNGVANTFLGFPIQAGQGHITKLDGAIRFAEMSNIDTIYITDANNITHDNITINDAKRALMEVMGVALLAHKKKQDLRQDVLDPNKTVNEIKSIHW